MRAPILSRSVLVSLGLAAGLFVAASPARAQVQRRSDARAPAQLDPGGVRVVDPLKTEVESLRNRVTRLEAALASLRLTVKANQAAYAKHRHGVSSYGITAAKSICPNTPAIDGTMLVITTSAGPPKGLSGTPE